MKGGCGLKIGEGHYITMKDGIMLIEKSARKNIWLIREDFTSYLTRKNLYSYDFGIVIIKKKDGDLQKYCNHVVNTNIVIGCERIGKVYHMQVKDMYHNVTMNMETIDYIFIYFEKDSQALLAFTTAETFSNTGFFLNSVSSMDVPSLREEAMSIIYMMDETKAMFRMFNRYINYDMEEEGADSNEREE